MDNKRIIEYKGRKYYLAELAREFGLSAPSLHYRLKQGWPIEKALTTPLSNNGLKGNKSRRKCEAVHWKECFECKLRDCTRGTDRPLQGESRYWRWSE